MSVVCLLREMRYDCLQDAKAVNEPSPIKEEVQDKPRSSGRGRGARKEEEVCDTGFSESSDKLTR